MKQEIKSFLQNVKFKSANLTQTKTTRHKLTAENKDIKIISSLLPP